MWPQSIFKNILDLCTHPTHMGGSAQSSFLLKWSFYNRSTNGHQENQERWEKEIFSGEDS